MRTLTSIEEVCFLEVRMIVLAALILSPFDLLASSDVGFTVIPSPLAGEMRTSPVIVTMEEHPNVLEKFIYSELISELRRAGFKVVSKDAAIVLQLKAQRGTRVSGMTNRPGFFRSYSDVESEDYANISIVAKKRTDEIWEGSIDGKTEDIIGEEAKYCLRTLLDGFLEHRAEQSDCEENP
jgi:hypothetical protein